MSASNTDDGSSRHDIICPSDAGPAWTVAPNGLTVVVDVEEDTWEVGDVPTGEHVHLVPVSTTVEMGSKHRRFSGVLDPVLQAAALAAVLAPNGRRESANFGLSFPSVCGQGVRLKPTWTRFTRPFSTI